MSCGAVLLRWCRIVERVIWPTHASCSAVRRRIVGLRRAAAEAVEMEAGLARPRDVRRRPEQRRRAPACTRTVVARRLRRRRLPSTPPPAPTNFYSPQLVRYTVAHRRRVTVVKARRHFVAISSRPVIDGDNVAVFQRRM